MCRLYGMRASHPTRAACELLDAQNSLISQAVQDGRGLENPHGWGVGVVRGGVAQCSRQVEPANASEQFRREALHNAAETVVAHVRRATVGEPRYENTHPFRDGDSFLAHNGHIGEFDEVRSELLRRLPERRRERIGGSTDSEHFYQLTLAHYGQGHSRTGALRRAAEDLRDLSNSVGDGELALNTLWAAKGSLAGTKLGRTLWYLERDEPIHCDLCGRDHAAPPEDESYRCVVVASEPITDEDWSPVPDASVFEIDENLAVSRQPLFERS